MSQDAIADNSGEKFVCKNGALPGITVTHATKENAGKADVAIFEDARFWNHYPANFTKNNSVLFQGYEYEIFKQDQKIGTLTMSSHHLDSQGGCRSRLGCGVDQFPGFVITQAHLKIGDNESTYNCN